MTFLQISTFKIQHLAFETTILKFNTQVLHQIHLSPINSFYPCVPTTHTQFLGVPIKYASEIKVLPLNLPGRKYAERIYVSYSTCNAPIYLESQILPLMAVNLLPKIFFDKLQ